MSVSIQPDPFATADSPPSEGRVVTEPGTRLQQLHAAYGVAKAELKSAEERFDAIAAGIKAELSVSGTPKVLLTGTEGADPLRLSWVVQRRLDSKRLAVDHPAIHATYLKEGGYWKLEPVKGGEESG